MKNKLVFGALAVLAILSALSYLGSTKTYTVTFTVKSSDRLTEEQRQAKLRHDKDTINTVANEDVNWGVSGIWMSGAGLPADSSGNVQLPPETSLPPETPKTAELTIQNVSGGTEQRTVNLPWTMTMEKHSGDFLYLSAQASKDTPYVDVDILSDGILVQHSESVGQYSIATASGKVQ